MQTDGNLVFFKGGSALYATGTSSHPGAYAAMQTDGNLVVTLRRAKCSGLLPLAAASRRVRGRADAAVISPFMTPITRRCGRTPPRRSSMRSTSWRRCICHTRWAAGITQRLRFPVLAWTAPARSAGYCSTPVLNIPTAVAGWFSSWGEPLSAGMNVNSGVFLYVVPPNVHIFMRINGRVFESDGYPNDATGGPQWTNRTDFSNTVVRHVPLT